MATLKQFLVLTLVGVTVTTLTIAVVFIIINVYIWKKAAKFRIRSKQNNYMSQTNKQGLHESPEAKAPPLPSRDQFLSEGSDTHSYEDVEAFPDYLKVEEDTKSLRQTPDFPFPNTSANHQDNISENNVKRCQNFDQLPHSAPESDGDLPDYVSLEDGEPVIPLQPFSISDHTQCHDNQSYSASYDDVGELGVGELDVSELDVSELDVSDDYDDVG